MQEDENVEDIEDNDMSTQFFAVSEISIDCFQKKSRIWC